MVDESEGEIVGADVDMVERLSGGGGGKD